MDSFTTSRLAQLSGISVDQLRQWDEDGLLRPGRVLRRRGRSQERRYTREQALGVMALGELRRKAISSWQIRAASALLPPRLSGYEYAVFDGEKLCAAISSEAAVELSSRCECSTCIIRLSRLVERL